VIEIDLPMPARILEAHPYVEEARNQVAVMRGPIVYCLESSDLPQDVRLNDVFLPTAVELTPEQVGDPLNAVVLRGKALAVSQESWSGKLYRDVEPLGRARSIDVSLVPYFAWGNRGESEMTVWIPAAR